MARTIAAFGPNAQPSDGQDVLVDSRGDLRVVDGIEDVRQRVVMRLRWWFGQWYLAVSEGVPYRPEIFTRPTSVGIAAAVVSDQIRSVDGVTGVADVLASIDPTDRTMRYSAIVRTAFGSFEMSETVT